MPKTVGKAVGAAGRSTAKVARPRQHEIDTMALREVRMHLPAAWVARNVESDYGIDLEVEPFIAGNSRGDLLLLQVKGTDSDLGADPWPFQMKVSGLVYAERFLVPVLLIVQPVGRNAMARFLWMQEYIRTVLDAEKPKWRNQQSVRLWLPTGNEFVSDEKRLLFIAGAPRRAEAFGQLARLAHEMAVSYSRWLMLRDAASLAVVRDQLAEVLALDALFGDSTWSWGQSMRFFHLEPAMRRFEMLLGEREVGGDLVPGLNEEYARDVEDRDELIRDIVRSELRLLPEQLGAMVSIGFDHSLGRTLWVTSGSHDF